MNPILTREESRAVDREAVDRLGLPGLLLMENAGGGAARELLRRSGHGRLCIVGGVGQNGGDAWVVARHAAAAGVAVDCFLVDPHERGPSGDAAQMFRALEASGVRVTRLVRALEPLNEALVRATWVVDGLYGTGLTRDVVGLDAGALESMQARGAPLCSLDLPSGIDADTGAVRGYAPTARLTVTFGARKRGLVCGAGLRHSGEVAVVALGIAMSPNARAAWFEPSDAADAFPERAVDVHKGRSGRVLVFAGHPGTSGAARLAARAAHRMGAGLVTLAVRADRQASLDGLLLETMTAPYDSVASAVALADAADAVVLGPGFGLGPDERALVSSLASLARTRLVLDADSLRILAEDGVDVLDRAPGPRVLTPHAGEAGRLLGSDAAAVEGDRFGALAALVAKTGACVVLKGARTLVAAPGTAALVNASGTAALAIGGSGDVLAGAIAGALAERHGLDDLRRVAAAVSLHGMAGALAAISDRGVIPGEVADALPRALEEAREAARARRPLPT